MTLGDLASEGEIQLTETAVLSPLLQQRPKGGGLMVDRPLLHDTTQTTMTLITWEVMALIISRQHNIDY